MKSILRAIFFFSLCPSLCGQTNLIKAGDFSDSTAWKLGIYSNAAAHGSIVNGGYLVSIDNPGTDAWSVQFTQGSLKIENDSIYRFSFDASSTKPRTIQASICMSNGPYFPYSGRNTLTLTSTPQSFEWLFIMKQHTDTSARVEFNCGACSGNILFNNVKLTKVAGPILKLESPEPGTQYNAGYPIAINWISSGYQSPVKIELSTDNGFTWQDIISSTPDTGSYLWNPSGIFSPWCLIRISVVGNDKISSVNDIPFSIEPETEMIYNGTFAYDISGWNLGVYGGKASVSATGEICKIKVDSAGNQDWHIQFTQTGLHIQKGVTYVLSYTASAEKSCSISVKVSRDGGSYEIYSDSTHSLVNLTTQPQQFTNEFTANDTCSDARLEFNCGLVATTITLDNISLSKKYVTGLKFRAGSVHSLKISHMRILSIGHGYSTFILNGKIMGYSITNLIGQKVYKGSELSRKNTGKVAQGLYLTAPQ